jgi:hypothetical protein
MSDPGERAGLHAALWCHFDEKVGTEQLFAAALIEGVGVKNLAAVISVEDATSWLLCVADFGHLEIVKHLPFGKLVRGCRRLEVVIEVAAGRRHPGEVPAHPFLERCDFRPRCTRDGGKREIMMFKVLPSRIDMIAKE